MLTKDLLQFTSRKGKVVPTFISQGAMLGLATDLHGAYRAAPGSTLDDIEDKAAEVQSSASCAAGLSKLLMDRCTFEEPGEEVLTERWRLIELAEEIRGSQSWTTRGEFEALMAQKSGGDLSSLREQLFSDHPQRRRCLEFRDIAPPDLIDKYNRSLVQTMMLFADDVRITVYGASLIEKRAVFRHLKFHGLMTDVDVNKDSKEFTLYLSGPLKLFLKSTTYGIRLARFLPTILHLKEWQIEADLQLKNKRMTLTLDQSSPLKPTKNKGLAGYTPEEYSMVMDAFNADDNGWKMSVSDEFLHLGKQSYCFPDFTVRKAKKAVHVELFHPWHRGQILSRVKAAADAKVDDLRVGVERSLLKDKEVKAVLDESPWFIQHGFTFTQFPTSKQVFKAVDKDV